MHDSALLNKVTPSGERIYIIVKVKHINQVTQTIQFWFQASLPTFNCERSIDRTLDFSSPVFVQRALLLAVKFQNQFNRLDIYTNLNPDRTRTFKYMTLRRGRKLAQTIRVPSYGTGDWPNRHITFIVAEKV